MVRCAFGDEGSGCGLDGVEQEWRWGDWPGGEKGHGPTLPQLRGSGNGMQAHTPSVRLGGEVSRVADCSGELSGPGKQRTPGSSLVWSP